MLIKKGIVITYTIKISILFLLLTIFKINSLFAQDPSVLPTLPTQPVTTPTITQPQDKISNGADINGTLAKPNKIVKDSLIREATPQSNNKTEQTYGMNLFRGGQVLSISDLSTPPLDYPIGVYDQIVVSLWGGSEATTNYTVARDGSIFPKGIGKIYLQGLTYEQVRALLTERFKAVTAPGTNISVSIGQPRTISVNVAGEVETQGPVTVSAFTNAFNVIALAGGPTDLANLREILVKRNGIIIDKLDIYKYLTTGDFGKHIYLENNDFVILQTVEKSVKAEGKFKRPMYYQLKKDEGIKALLKYSGGLLKEAFSSDVKIYRTELEKQTIADVNVTEIINPMHNPNFDGRDFLLMDGDIIKVIAVNSGLVNKVDVKGEVSYPGQYEIKKGDRLFDVINRAGGITRNTYLSRAYIFRGSGDSTKLNSNRLEVDLTDITDPKNINSQYNVELFATDQILLFNANSFSDRQTVEIFGEVRKPGKVNKYGGMTLQDLIYLSGGLKQSAEFGRIEISSVMSIDSSKFGQRPTRIEVRQIKVSPNLEIDSVSAKIKLNAYDQVYVRKNPAFEIQQLVSINGLIKYPGPYPRLNKYERLSSYIDRAGGIMENADLSGAILYRKKKQYYRDNVLKNINALKDSVMGFNVDFTKSDYSKSDSLKAKADSLKAKADSLKAIDDSTRNLQEPISIDLYKALKNKNSKDDIILEEGDIIFIPEVNPFVSVKGTVQAPLKLTFDKEHTSLMYYIDKAGGYGLTPWRSRVYVQYANGKSKRTKNLFFMHFYPKIAEGCTINVPLRGQGTQVGEIFKQTGLSVVTIVAASIVAKIVAGL